MFMMMSSSMTLISSVFKGQGELVRTGFVFMSGEGLDTVLEGDETRFMGDKGGAGGGIFGE